MDKINRTLLGIDDIRLRQEAVERKVFAFTADGEKSGHGMTFGVFDAKNAALVVAFDGGEAKLEFCGEVIASGCAPLVAVVSGKGELFLSEPMKNARALVIGAKRVKT